MHSTRAPISGNPSKSLFQASLSGLRNSKMPKAGPCRRLACLFILLHWVICERVTGLLCCAPMSWPTDSCLRAYDLFLFLFLFFSTRSRINDGDRQLPSRAVSPTGEAGFCCRLLKSQLLFASSCMCLHNTASLYVIIDSGWCRQLARSKRKSVERIGLHMYSVVCINVNVNPRATGHNMGA